MEFLLRDIIVFLCILYILRAIFRALLPMLFQSVVNKAQQHQQNQQTNYQQTKKNEGSIKVDYIPQPKKGKVPDSEGDFIDYEEIK